MSGPRNACAHSSCRSQREAEISLQPVDWLTDAGLSGGSKRGPPEWAAVGLSYSHNAFCLLCYFVFFFISHNLWSPKHRCPSNPLPNVIVKCRMHESAQLGSNRGSRVLCHHQALSKPWRLALSLDRHPHSVSKEMNRSYYFFSTSLKP